VKDNGQGFDSHDIKGISMEPHWGLLSMQQRAASIGAELVIDSAIGKGTEVCVTLRRNHRGN
jgi:signal transduction histidine kinase